MVIFNLIFLSIIRDYSDRKIVYLSLYVDPVHLRLPISISCPTKTHQQIINIIFCSSSSFTSASFSWYSLVASTHLIKLIFHCLVIVSLCSIFILAFLYQSFAVLSLNKVQSRSYYLFLAISSRSRCCLIDQTNRIASHRIRSYSLSCLLFLQFLSPIDDSSLSLDLKMISSQLDNPLVVAVSKVQMRLLHSEKSLKFRIKINCIGVKCSMISDFPKPYRNS